MTMPKLKKTTTKPKRAINADLAPEVMGMRLVAGLRGQCSWRAKEPEAKEPVELYGLFWTDSKMSINFEHCKRIGLSVYPFFCLFVNEIDEMQNSVPAVNRLSSEDQKFHFIRPLT